MFGFSLGKLIILALIMAAVWYGFKYIGRLQRIDKGERKVGERGFGERLRKAGRGKGSKQSNTNGIEDTEKCPTCGAYVSVDGVENCGKPACPY